MTPQPELISAGIISWIPFIGLAVCGLIVLAGVTWMLAIVDSAPDKHNDENREP